MLSQNARALGVSWLL